MIVWELAHVVGKGQVDGMKPGRQSLIATLINNLLLKGQRKIDHEDENTQKIERSLYFFLPQAKLRFAITI